MRRLALIIGTVSAVLLIALGHAFSGHAHTRLLFALGVLRLAVVTSPVWTVQLWGGRSRAWLGAVMVLVQLPATVAVITPSVDPVLHLAIALAALGATAVTLGSVRVRVPLDPNAAARQGAASLPPAVATDEGLTRPSTQPRTAG